MRDCRLGLPSSSFVSVLAAWRTSDCYLRFQNVAKRQATLVTHSAGACKCLRPYFSRFACARSCSVRRMFLLDSCRHSAVPSHPGFTDLGGRSADRHPLALPLPSSLSLSLSLSSSFSPASGTLLSQTRLLLSAFFKMSSAAEHEMRYFRTQVEDAFKAVQECEAAKPSNSKRDGARRCACGKRDSPKHTSSCLRLSSGTGSMRRTRQTVGRQRKNAACMSNRPPRRRTATSRLFPLACSNASVMRRRPRRRSTGLKGAALCAIAS
ncbi:hypothetical protein BJY59DRAFT_51784 [Rhodotorula toruloides]